MDETIQESVSLMKQQKERKKEKKKNQIRNWQYKTHKSGRLSLIDVCI